MAESGDAAVFKWTDEHTRLLIQWRVANEALFTGKRNAAIKGFELFVTEQNLDGKVSAAQVKRKWENLKQKYKDLKYPQTGVSTENGEVTAASWKWYAVLDEALGGRLSITLPTLIASSGSDVAVTSPSSVRSTVQRAGRKRKDIEEVMYEMEEKEAQREMEAVEREERRWREMMEREERRERERREHEERREQQAREREERRDREMREREERRDRETKEREERFLQLLELLAKK